KWLPVSIPTELSCWWNSPPTNSTSRLSRGQEKPWTQASSTINPSRRSQIQMLPSRTPTQGPKTKLGTEIPVLANNREFCREFFAFRQKIAEFCPKIRNSSERTGN